jgi:hypothetical protein
VIEGGRVRLAFLLLTFLFFLLLRFSLSCSPEHVVCIYRPPTLAHRILGPRARHQSARSHATTTLGII